VVAVEVARGADRHTLRLPATDAWVVAQVFEKGEYSGVPPAALYSPPTVVDVGAHAGTFALYAKLVYHRDAAVHCFEPYPPHVELLRRNLGPFPGVAVHPVALGRADRTADLFLDPGSGAGHSVVPGLVPRPSGQLPVPVRDAAAVWDELELHEVDVLKVDAEGAEADILERLGPRLARVRAVLVEYHSAADRRRVDALLTGHELFGAIVHSPRVGTLKYLRSDLVA
jgi:FkbM family methyltransferase